MVNSLGFGFSLHLGVGIFFLEPLSFGLRSIHKIITYQAKMSVKE
jgi:hypothetical protein